MILKLALCITKDPKTCELTLTFTVEDDMKKPIFLVDGSKINYVCSFDISNDGLNFPSKIKQRQCNTLDNLKCVNGSSKYCVAYKK